MNQLLELLEKKNQRYEYTGIIPKNFYDHLKLGDISTITLHNIEKNREETFTFSCIHHDRFPIANIHVIHIIHGLICVVKNEKTFFFQLNLTIEDNNVTNACVFLRTPPV